MLLYMEVYDHYRDLIESGVLKSGDRMPSLRSASAEMSKSLTTIENAYFQLAAEGFIIARPQSGYYVTDIVKRQDLAPASGQEVKSGRPGSGSSVLRYDFASSGVDRGSFRFDLWQRYIKSALRQDERLLSYGEPQGEYDFRVSLASYVRERRNILCTPEQIVVGAGVQSLLHLLCPLLKGRSTVSFPTPSFTQGISVFSDHGFKIHYRDKDADVVYVSPAHMNRWGDIMPVKRRMELVTHAGEKGSLIIEDDYENEFVYLQKPAPSLYGLTRQQNVIYVGSFSRLLLPSIRISYMILPFPILESYRKISAHYNQTASKAEQIALSQFIRDGHLTAQARRLRRLYAQKQAKLCEAAGRLFGPSCTVQSAPAGTMISLSIPISNEKDEDAALLPERLMNLAGLEGLRIPSPEVKDGSVTFLLSCSSMPEDDFENALALLASICSKGCGFDSPRKE